MFCPMCRAEYRTGITECADCGIPLVDSLDDVEEELELANEEIEFVCILEIQSRGDLAFVESMLNSEGIPYYIQGDPNLNLRKGYEPARIWVEKHSSDLAMELLSDFKPRLFSVSDRND